MSKFGRFDVYFDQKKAAAMAHAEEIVMLKKQRGSFCDGLPDRPENAGSPHSSPVKQWRGRKAMSPVSLARISAQNSKKEGF